MPKRSLLGWFDRGNQRAMDYVRSRPDAGLKVLPYARSDSARRWGIAMLIGVGLAGFIFGWLGGVIALAVAAPFFWGLEHHFFFNKAGGDDVEDGVD